MLNGDFKFIFIRPISKMPATQSTLGYVKNSQTSLAKFFGKPKGVQIPAKQSKLTFLAQSPANKNDVEKIQGNSHAVSTNSRKEMNKQTKNETADIKKRSISKSKSPVRNLKVESKIDEKDDKDEAPITKRRRLQKRENCPCEEIPSESELDVKIKSEIRTPKKRKRATNIPDQFTSEIVMPNSEKKVNRDNPREENNTYMSTSSELGSKNPLTSTLEINQETDTDVNNVEDHKQDMSDKTCEKIQMTLEQKAQDPYPDWKPGDPVPYAALCTTFSLIEMTSKRLIIASYCSLFLRQVLRLTPNDLLPTVLLMVNKLAADYSGIELGIGESLIMKAIGESTGRSLAVIKENQKEIGDLGLVAVKSRARQPTMFAPKPLTIRGVHKALIEIATVSGQGAQTRKVDLIKKILSSADAKTAGAKVDITENKGGASEAKFIVRFLEGKLRLGLAEKTVLISLAQAVVHHEFERKTPVEVPNPEKISRGESIIKTVFSEIPSYDIIIPAMLKYGIFNLRENCKLHPGIPLKPMLAKPTKAITEVLDRFENQKFTCEYKYDGERAQIHYVAEDSPIQYAGPTSIVSKTSTGGFAAIFSRNSEDLSKKYPDILSKLNTWVKPETKSFVLDCESVAWDINEKKVLPFQQLMTRKKKDVKVEDVKVKVCVFAFDLLYLNGEAVVEKPLRDRRELLYSAFIPIQGEFAFAAGMDGQELDEIQAFLEDSVKASCEGLMVKMLDGAESSYEPSKRSRNWLKIKKDYLSGIGDSLDLVVLGAYHGKGKRTSVYGAFLLACYNPTTDGYETICNIGTGFSEVLLEELHNLLSNIVIDKPKPYYFHASSGSHQPDVWFEPKYVWEVKTADLTLSPRYKAGFREGVDKDKGISLRFPRFIKIRDDKKPEMATCSKQVVEMYRRQESFTKSQGPAVDDDFEY
ncbi:DNA ligase 1 [Erysiphe neolycopersici]|uniref:DNA ligase n=1 Tax=Erysiphe neolycopersici TaxID=212602 RepID=A0A420I636_9PEZI|nr:DNA ligase 1 [Erysiphe neolycopersici]